MKKILFVTLFVFAIINTASASTDCYKIGDNLHCYNLDTAKSSYWYKIGDSYWGQDNDGHTTRCYTDYAGNIHCS